jgi:superfamily II DNA or RNA helicase
MFLDLKNNELIFSQIADIKEFKGDLQAMKEVKSRDYKNNFYISLEHFNVVREVLSQKYREQLGFSLSYEKFANNFVLNKKNPIFIKWMPATCYIQGAGLPWNEIIPATSYLDKKAKNSKLYGKTWSGYVHLFNVTEGCFPSGLLERILSILDKHDIPYHVEREFEYPEPYFNLKTTFSFEPTEDQFASVEALDAANCGIGKLPTGFGKTSFVASSLIAKKGVRSMFIANQRVLTDDAKADFDEVFAGNDIKIGMIGDGVFEPGDITVASIQTISVALKPPTAKEQQVANYQLELAEQRLQFATDEEHKKECEKEVKKFQNRVRSIEKQLKRHAEIIPFLQSVDLFVVDEAQVLGTDSWNEFLHACPAPYRYTLSATPVRTDGGGIQIVAATGEQRYVSSAGEQIEKGRLAEFIGHFTKFDHKMDKKIMKDLKLDYHQAYDIFIVQNDVRNRFLCNKVVEWAKDYYVLALVTRKAHGEIVKNILVEMGMDENDIHYIDGDTPKKLRQDTIAAYRNGEFKVLIGTSVFDVGFNAKNASKIVRFNAGGSEVREPQRAGRTVRMREDGSIGESFDVLDVNVPFFESQAWKRVRFLKEEFGADRVRFQSGIIEGELNIVGLKAVVANIPDETDRQKGEEIIQALMFGERDYEEIPDINLDDLDRDLESLLAELEFPV